MSLLPPYRFVNNDAVSVASTFHDSDTSDAHNVYGWVTTAGVALTHVLYITDGLAPVQEHEEHDEHDDDHTPMGLAAVPNVTPFADNISLQLDADDSLCDKRLTESNATPVRRLDSSSSVASSCVSSGLAIPLISLFKEHIDTSETGQFFMRRFVSTQVCCCLQLVNFRLVSYDCSC